MSQSRESFEDYEGFVDKFRPKLTTDDCYTPPEVYDVVAGWVASEYGLDRSGFVRPFWPGGDYEGFEYPEGCAVVDNPPFSILSKIVRFYLDRGIRFFLFCPSLTALGSARNWAETCAVVCDANITYHNGAVVRTAFTTNLEPGYAARTAPELGRAINAKCEEIAKRTKAELPKYTYPDEVVTAAMMQRWAKYGVDYRLRRSDCARVSALDSQREAGKAIYGGGLLLSPGAAERRAAAERAAAERAAATRWPLSERERALCASLG